MGATVYFSKINLNSHILEVYKCDDGNKMLRSICDQIIVRFNDGIKYIREEETYTDEDGDVHTYDATYTLTSVIKHESDYDYSISGSIHKKSFLFYKVMGDEGKLIPRKVENSELINFYYDVYREMVCFYTSIRFGYVEFNEAFKGILNQAMFNPELSDDEQYYFNVELYKKSLSIDNIKDELKNIGKIKSLRVDIKAPNAASNLIKKINQSPGERIKAMKEGNITEKSTLLTSNAPNGLQIDTLAVSNELDEIKNIHEYLSDTDALDNGYAEVEAEGVDGTRYTTKDKKPFKRNITDNQKYRGEFIKICKEAIRSLLL